MNTPLKLSLFCLVLAALFAGSYVAGAELVPEATVDEWTKEADEITQEHGAMDTSSADGMTHKMTSGGSR